MIWAAAVGGVFIAAALSLVIYLGGNRGVVIADTGSSSQTAGFSGAGNRIESPGQAVSLQKSGGEGMFLRIPVETAIRPENITVENQYADRGLSVFLRGATGAFYKSSNISGHTETVENASYITEEEGVLLYIKFSELYECESILKNGYIQVNLYKPEEQYERVVILDVEPPEDSDEEAEEILYQTAETLEDLLEEKEIKVYGTFDRDEKLTAEEMRAFAEETDADIYIGLTLARDEDKEQFGTYVCYNGTYFRPDFTNGSFADIMERALVTEINGRARGLIDTKEGILGELSIPAVMICPGYLSHETEGRLLKQEAYQDKIAEGICEGVLAAYEKRSEG